MTDVMRQQYRQLTDDEAYFVKEIKEKAAELYDLVDGTVRGRERALAQTKIEEAVMWAVKGITG